MSVFEYGSGASTLWWAACVKEVGRKWLFPIPHLRSARGPQTRPCESHGRIGTDNPLRPRNRVAVKIHRFVLFVTAKPAVIMERPLNLQAIQTIKMQFLKEVSCDKSKHVRSLPGTIQQLCPSNSNCMAAPNFRSSVFGSA